MKNSVKNVLKFSAGFLTCLLLVITVPLLVLAAGMIDMSAKSAPGKIESRLAPWALDRSMARRAPETKNPFANASPAIAFGLAHYRENCVLCHGAPNVEPAELARGLNPPAPKLQVEDSQSLSDGQLFWIIKNGIRMTGMPAFGETHSDEKIWHIIAFVRHLPKITDAESDALKPAVSNTEHHHGTEGSK